MWSDWQSIITAQDQFCVQKGDLNPSNGVAAAGRLANQGRKQTSARKPSRGEVSAARQTGAGKTSTAAPQNGQNEQHYHRKGASAVCA